jgi:hypothetical protein
VYKSQSPQGDSDGDEVNGNTNNDVDLDSLLCNGDAIDPFGRGEAPVPATRRARTSKSKKGDHDAVVDQGEGEDLDDLEDDDEDASPPFKSFADFKMAADGEKAEAGNPTTTASSSSSSSSSSTTTTTTDATTANSAQSDTSVASENTSTS